MALLTEAMGEGMSARWQERQVRKPAQQFAVQLIDRAGLVIPKVTMDSHWNQGTFGTVVGAVKKQLVLSAALEAGATSVNDPAFALRKEAIETMVDGIDQADLRFGLDRSFGAYRLLAGAAEQTGAIPAPDPAGVELVPTGELDLDMANVGGNVLKSGMQRGDIATDIMARVGPAQAASQCFEVLTPVPWGTANMGKVSAFQDAFMIGDTFRRRLSQMRQLTAGWSSTKFSKLADAGATELRTWTGPSYGFQVEFGGNLYVRLLGIAPEDLGVSSPAEMTGRVVAVWGKPWVADCAAKLRGSCPDNFETSYVRTPSAEWVNEQTYQYSEVFGADGRALELEIPLLSGPTSFTPSFTPVGQPPSEALYIVSKSDPKNPGFGKVLATLALRQYPSGQRPGYFLVSDYQRKLANDIFGVSNKWEMVGPKVGESSAGSSPSSCIEGVPKDFFVPLENELTSDSDSFESSWKHYLSLAKQAAMQADALGDKLIEIGLQQDFRREAATEELGKLCGDFTALENVKVDKGVVLPTADDSTMNDCIDEPKHDVVFLTSKPPFSDEDIKTKILKCPNANPVCEQSTLSIGAMGLVPYEDPVAQGIAEPAACDQHIDVVGSLASDFQGSKLADLANDPNVSAASMATVLKALRLRVDADLHWNAELDGARVMSTYTADSDDTWPSCGACTLGQSPTASQRLAAQLKAVFGQFNVVGSATDRDAALQRVTGAMWLMGAMSGLVPEGRFTLPIPAYNGTNQAGTDEAFPVTIYGTGLFDLDNQTYRLNADPGFGEITSDDVTIINDSNGKSINSVFQNAVHTDLLRPPWIRAIYNQAGKHIHLTASNIDRPFPQIPTAQWIMAQANLLSGAKADSSGACVHDVAKKEAVKAEHRKVKYPEKGLEKVCTTPNGKSSLLVATRNKMYLKDVFAECISGGAVSNDIIPNTIWKGATGHHLTTDDTTLACKHGWDSETDPQFALQKVMRSCMKDANFDGDSVAIPYCQEGRYFARRATAPSHCRPGNRAHLFINSNNSVDSGCDVARELSQAVALTCVLNAGFKGILGGEPWPAMKDAQDIAKLEAWLMGQSKQLRRELSRMYLTKVPKRVLSDALDGEVGAGSYKGDHGQLVLQYRQHLSSLGSGWLDLASEIDALSGAIGNARTRLVAEKLNAESASLDYAMQQIGIHASIAKAAVNGAFSIASGLSGAPGAATAAIDYDAATKQLALLDKAKQLADDKHANAVVGILNDLNVTTGQHYTNIKKSLESIRIGVTEARKTASALEQQESTAKYQVAKGLGEPYSVDADGKVTAIYPVNTVLRRQYDITQRRYQAALKDAQRLSYMARLAIEQRIGMRLEAIEQPVGSLEEPSKWANDVCTFQGIDYKRLRKEALPESNIFQKIESVMWDKFVDPYIGDYVDKLEKFVEFYNIQYPSHEGDDTAVLSIRDDLLGPQGTCFRPSKNLLYFSHALTRLEPGSDDGVEPPRGWKRVFCAEGDPKCMSLAEGSTLKLNQAPLAPPGVSSEEGTTWLYNVNPPVEEVSDGGTDGGVEAGEGGTTEAGAPNPAPSGSVYQDVDLQIGSFVLSWFDRAWGASSTDPGPMPAGGPDAGAGSPANYFVGVYGPNWELVQPFTALPNVPVAGDGGADAGSPNPWSERRVLAFTTTSAGTHHVVFSATAPGLSYGSVVIADVQLEQAPSPTPYEATSASRVVLTGDCAFGNGEVFRQAFHYSCDTKNCFYDLRAPFNVQLGETLAGSALAGKVAQDNFNYRHVNLALNVVGTGVIDCSKKPSPSCFGSPYLEYTLEHSAYAAPVIAHDNIAREFNFGLGAVRFGKALAAERFITLPLSSADQGLLSQPQFTKVELRGRPLEGTYRLRVYDNPALNWSHVEDIQIVLNYRYWSKVDNSSQQK